MYPWRNSLTAWAASTKLEIDALGLITILGIDEMDIIIGRLVPSPYLAFLPLLGVSVVAGKRFSKKQSGFTLYNISAGIITTELAGWFTRWLKAQPLCVVRSKVTWELKDRPPRWTAMLVGLLLIGLPLHGMLIAMTVLAGDWWGFANAVAMLLSVVVRWVLVKRNQDGIDANIQRAKDDAEKLNFKERYAKYMANVESAADARQTDPALKLPELKPPKSPYDMAKVIVLTDDSKVVTIEAPMYLMRWVFLAPPKVKPSPIVTAVTWVAWVAFAVHIVSIGMSALYTQIYSVIFLALSTIMTAYKVGCDDSTLWTTIRKAWSRNDEDEEEVTTSCWVSSLLKGTVSTYPPAHAAWDEVVQVGIEENKYEAQAEIVPTRHNSVERARGSQTKKKKKKELVERRQDLFVWLRMTPEEEEHLKVWNLIPRNDEWFEVYKGKKEIHNRRPLESNQSERFDC